MRNAFVKTLSLLLAAALICPQTASGASLSSSIGKRVRLELVKKKIVDGILKSFDAEGLVVETKKGEIAVKKQDILRAYVAKAEIPAQPSVEQADAISPADASPPSSLPPPPAATDPMTAPSAPPSAPAAVPGQGSTQTSDAGGSGGGKFWKSRSKKKLAWGWGLLVGGTAAVSYGLSEEEVEKREISSCGPGCTQETWRTTPEQKNVGLAYAGIGAGLTGLAFLISYGLSKDVPASSRPVQNDKPQGKRGFWHNKSKKKLWWGLALTALGGSAAAYGLKKEEVWEDADTSLFPLGDRISYDENFSNSGVVVTISSTVENESGSKARVVITTDYTTRSGTLITSSSTDVTLDAGEIADWSTVSRQTYSQYDSWYYFDLRVSSAQKAVMKQKNKNLAYAGIGSAVLGLSFLLSYAANSALPAQKAENLEISPVFYAQNTSSYQGLMFSYRY